MGLSRSISACLSPAPVVLALAALASLISLPGPAAAQDYRLCVKLEARLVELDRASGGGSAVNIKKYDTAISEQQRRLSVARQQALRAGCGQQKGFLFFRPPRPPQCHQIESSIEQMESNLRTLMSRSRAEAQPVSSGASASERRNILEMLGENRCGPQYERYARTRNNGLFGMFLRDYTRDPYMQDGGYGTDRGFGTGREGFYGTYRTLCVRTCDGFFWPISFSTVQGHFDYDAQLCQRSCPSADVTLYVHRNPGEGPEQAMSLAGLPYSASANAFRYRTEYVKDCSCRAGVQTAALGERVVVDLAARDGTLPPDDARSGLGRIDAGRAVNTGRGWDGLFPNGRDTGAWNNGEADGGGRDTRERDASGRVPDEPAFLGPVRAALARSTPIPRPRPGNAVPVAGTVATLTGMEDFLAVAAPAVRQVAGKSVRVVGPGFTLYRTGGEDHGDKHQGVEQKSDKHLGDEKTGED